MNGRNPSPQRGEVWDIDFDPTRGAEIQKIRPAVVISSDAIGRLPLRMVVPITGWRPEWHGSLWHVRLDPDSTNGLAKASAVDILQIRGVDVVRFERKRGRLSAVALEEIVAAIVAVVEYS